MLVPKVDVKRDPHKRWRQPERRFFACGACHLLTYAHLEHSLSAGCGALWIHPRPGFTGKHVFVSDGRTSFHYHGVTRVHRLLEHYLQRARRYHPGWDATVEQIEVDELLGRGTRDGLHLMPPAGFDDDALERARAFMARFAMAETRLEDAVGHVALPTCDSLYARCVSVAA